MSFVPVIAVSYFFLRLQSRIQQLRNLFTLPGILEAYLASRGKDVSRDKGEAKKQWLQRLRTEFDKIFRTETAREYGKARYLIGIFVGTASTALVVYLLATGPLSAYLSAGDEPLPSPITFALLGAFAWTVWLLLSAYEALDLVPTAFFWMPFRYIVALIIGLLSTIIFRIDNGMASVFAIVATAIPYPKMISFLRARVKIEQALEGEPRLHHLQGMHQSTIDKLQLLGINTTQELAYFDPLTLLFRTNFSPKVVIDWIDQALLYNYVTDEVVKLRKRGIRGAIEFFIAAGEGDLAEQIADVLEITKAELDEFVEMMGADYQVQLIYRIWNEFEIPESQIGDN